MEYEICDDPQGLPDRQDCDRAGGLREHVVQFRKAPVRAYPHHADASDEDSAPLQMGELV